MDKIGNKEMDDADIDRADGCKMEGSWIPMLLETQG